MSELRDRILTLLTAVAGANAPATIDPGASLFDAGVLDSFLLPELVSALEREFRIEIPTADLRSETFESVDKISAYLQTRS
jgi:acyl carrier protein